MKVLLDILFIFAPFMFVYLAIQDRKHHQLLWFFVIEMLMWPFGDGRGWWFTWWGFIGAVFVFNCSVISWGRTRPVRNGIERWLPSKNPSAQMTWIMNRFRNQKHPRVYVGAEIPRYKLINMAETMIFPRQPDRVYVLIDTTIFGSGNTGVALTERGVYWYSRTEVHRMFWHEFAAAPKNPIIKFDRSDPKLFSILNEVYEYVRSNPPRPGAISNQQESQPMKQQAAPTTEARVSDAKKPATAPTSTALVDVNTAAEVDIALLPGIGPILAKKAVQVRAEVNGFRSMEQFAEHLGLKPHIVERVAPLVTFLAVESSQQEGNKPRGGRIVDF